MDRLFIRQKDQRQSCSDGITCGQQNIAVTGLGQCVGTTFVASSLAFFFKEKVNSVTFCQCSQPSRARRLLYDEVAMEQRFSNRPFTDFYRLIVNDQRLWGKKNLEEEINWILPMPCDCKEELHLNEAQRNRLIHSARGDICVFDLEAHRDWNVFLQDMDMVVVVVDPMPSGLIQSTRRFTFLKQLELSGTNTLWLVNKMNSGVSRRQVIGYLRNNKLLWMDQIEPALIYADEYACRFHWKNKEVRCRFMDIFTKVSQF